MAIVVLVPVGIFAFPAGFLWGTHESSPYHPWSPYVFMLLAMYAGWAILMITSARDPIRNAVIVTYGVIANVLHAFVMLVQSFVLPAEVQHLVADVPFLFLLAAVCWYWHPARIQTSELIGEQ